MRAKGPSIFVDRGEVSVTLAEHPPGEAMDDVQRTFEEETGYRLSIAEANAEQPADAGDSIREQWRRDRRRDRH